MSDLRNILFPVDLSEASTLIVSTVQGLAEKLGATIHVVYVVRAMGHYSNLGVAFAYTQAFEEQLSVSAETRLADFVEKHFQNVTVESTLVRGYPAEEILRYADEENIDLIAMGTHGRKGLERIIFGSVAEHVVKNASVPVLTINPYRQKAGPAV